MIGKNFGESNTEVYLELCQTFMMQLFDKNG